jgi:hypothetical protein
MARKASFPLAQELVRALGRALRDAPGATTRLGRAAEAAAGAGVPEPFLLPAVTILRRRQEEHPAASPALSRKLIAVLEAQAPTARRNVRLLAALGDRARIAGEGPPVLLGGAATLVAVYGDLGAFSPRVWICGVAGISEAGSALDQHLRGMPGVFGSFGLDDGLEQWTALAGDLAPGWLIPSRAAFLALGAARLGDPLAHPQPPAWFHVAAAATAWGPEVGADEVMATADLLGVSQHCERGLAILNHLFPELTRWSSGHCPARPLLERLVAIPVAAHKLVAVPPEPAPFVFEHDPQVA